MSPERTHWRDMALSSRHRTWGWDCPAVDIDFLLVEYNHGHPMALVEYKHQLAKKADVTHPSYRALIELANRAELPLFVVSYELDQGRFTPQALNPLAINLLPQTQTMQEKEYVDFLYALRKRSRPTADFPQAST